MIISLIEKNWLAGSHVSKQKTLHATIQSAIDKGMYSFQFFLGSPQSYDRARVSDEDLKKSITLVEKFPIGVFSHLPYKYNLCGSTKHLAWTGHAHEDSKVEYFIPEIEHELGVMANFKMNGVVIHPGTYKDKEEGLRTIAKTINKINFPKGSKLLLENAAGQGTYLGTTLQELKTMIDHISKEKQEHIGVCIDTCHIHAFGDYNLSKVGEVERLFTDFDKIIGLDRLCLIHLNDSKVEQGTRVDRHELIGKGTIWGKSTESLIYLLEMCTNRKNPIPLVLETEPEDMKTLFELSQK